MKSNHVSIRRDRKGFTLVELLVVIAIIGILIALLLPAVQAAREAARRAQCSNNCKQIGLALHNYHDTYRAFPMAFFASSPDMSFINGKSWGTAILPYLEQQALFDQFDHNRAPFDPPLGSATNVAVIQTPVAAFVCPSAPGGIDREYRGSGALDAATDANLQAMGFDQIEWYAAPSDYCATESIRGGYRRLSGDTSLGTALGVLPEHMNFAFAGVTDTLVTKFADILDGTSNTFIVGERTGGDKIYEGANVADVSAMASALGIAEWQVVGGNGGGWGDVLNGELDFQGSVHGAVTAGVFTTGPCAINCSNVRELSFHSFHPGGANFVMADASVQFITETITPAAFAARYTRSGGEIIPQ